MKGITDPAIPVVASRDRRCRGWTLDNWLRRWWAPATAEADLLAIRPGQHVVDLGTGVGYLVPVLLERVGPEGTVDLVDPDRRNLSLAEARWGTDARVRVMCTSAAHLPEVPNGSVDRVLLSLVLCCMVDKEGAMEEAWRMLRPGGLALITYPERRRRLSAQKRTLRVSPELWSRLIVGHPWHVVESGRHRWIRRHVLEKPTS